MTSSDGISRTPKRDESMVTEDIAWGDSWRETEAYLSTYRLLEEIHERRLHDVRAGPQRGLVGGVLRVEVDQGLGEVGVLGVRELFGDGEADVVQARARGVEPVRLGAVARLRRHELVEVPVQR